MQSCVQSSIIVWVHHPSKERFLNVVQNFNRSIDFCQFNEELGWLVPHDSISWAILARTTNPAPYPVSCNHTPFKGEITGSALYYAKTPLPVMGGELCLKQ
jgi:hypothetical protein